MLSHKLTLFMTMVVVEVHILHLGDDGGGFIILPTFFYKELFDARGENELICVV